MSQVDVNIAALSPEERLELIGLLWDSLDDADVAVSNHERDLLDRRLDRIERDGASSVPWKEVRRRWASERGDP